MSDFNYLKNTEIGQTAEVFTTSITNNDLLNAIYSIPCLTTSERLNLSAELKTPNKLVYDKDERIWYSWSLVGGTYVWNVISFVDNFYMYNVQKREYKTILSADENDYDLYPYIGAYSPLREVMVVSLDGAILVEGVHYTVTIGSSSTVITTNGLWYKGQQLHVMVLYAGDDVTDLSQLVTDLQDEVGGLGAEIDNVGKQVYMNNLETVSYFEYVGSNDITRYTSDFVGELFDMLINIRLIKTPITINIASSYVVDLETKKLTLTDSPLTTFTGKLEYGLRLNDTIYDSVYCKITLEGMVDSVYKSYYGLVDVLAGTFTGYKEVANNENSTRVTIRQW